MIMRYIHASYLSTQLSTHPPTDPRNVTIHHKPRRKRRVTPTHRPQERDRPSRTPEEKARYNGLVVFIEEIVGRTKLEGDAMVRWHRDQNFRVKKTEIETSIA